MHTYSIYTNILIRYYIYIWKNHIFIHHSEQKISLHISAHVLRVTSSLKMSWNSHQHRGQCCDQDNNSVYSRLLIFLQAWITYGVNVKTVTQLLPRVTLRVNHFNIEFQARLMLGVNSKEVIHPNTRQKVGRKQALHSILLNNLDASASVLLATWR